MVTANHSLMRMIPRAPLYVATWLICLIATASAVPPSPAGATVVGDETCLSCHEEVVNAFSATAHGTGAGFDLKRPTCESCHGPGSTHVESGEAKDIWTFSALPANQASDICLTCHGGAEFSQFHAGAHGRNDIGCTACHDVHSENHQNLPKRDPELCYSCHQEIAAKMQMPSRHPVRDGKMKCGDCHDVHGGLRSVRSVTNTNDLCFTCHADKQGPFQFEHAAVVEGCNTCHDPHGTTVNNLLQKTEPFLCLQCHHIHFQITEHLDVRATASARCTQCHTAIHGSDLPSVLKSSGGRGLTR